jgi:hypothetical protein
MLPYINSYILTQKKKKEVKTSELSQMGDVDPIHERTRELALIASKYTS